MLKKLLETGDFEFVLHAAVLTTRGIKKGGIGVPCGGRKWGKEKERQWECWELNPNYLCEGLIGHASTRPSDL